MASPSAEEAQLSLKKSKILLVDDDLVVVKALTLKLEANGYDVISATDGATAVGLVRHEAPDLVILDINFPPDVGMSWDGFKIMEWFQGRVGGGRIPVIIITGEESEKNRERAAAAGAASFYQKPIDMNELLSDIREILAAAPRNAPADK